jgi:hypothetical protein
MEKGSPNSTGIIYQSVWGSYIIDRIFVEHSRSITGDNKRKQTNIQSSSKAGTSFFYYYYKVLLLGIFSVHTPGYKNTLNCSFNQFTWVVTHPVREIKGSDFLGF